MEEKGGTIWTVIRRISLLPVKRKQLKNTAQFSVEELVEFLVRLPAFARKPVCKFKIDGQFIVGRLVHKQNSILYIKHRFGKKAIRL